MKTRTKNLLSSGFNNILLEFYLCTLEAKEEYILKLSILLTVLWIYHHILIYINLLLLSNPVC